MTIIVFLLPIALGLATCFVIFFVVAAKQGQFDDLDTPAIRMLLDEENRSCDNDEPGTG